VIWLTDILGATSKGPPASLASAIAALRYMTQVGRQNALAEYARAGGQLWVAGGGAVLASAIEFNRTSNDVGGITLSIINNEIGPGRFPYDLGGWRSEIRAGSGPISITRYLGRFEAGGSPYIGLPAAMRPKSQATDPYPPGRSFNPGNFYLTRFDVDYLSRPNSIRNGDPDTRPGPGGSPLDSLYQATGALLTPPHLNPHNVAMTRFHGAFAHNPVLFTGFNIWSFTRSDCKQLVDFVLQDLWGMSPAPAAGLARAAP